MSAGNDRPRRSRHLTDEERKLWAAVARSVRRLKRGAPEEPALVEEPNVKAKQAPPPKSAAIPAAPPVRQKAAPPPLAPLGRRFRQKLGRGTEPIDLRIDLHGMTQAQAHHALARFLTRAQHDGARMALVITGKGARGDPHAERGVLKRLVPQWLGQPEFRAFVVGVESASAGHGGEGALYVRLRRKRER